MTFFYLLFAIVLLCCLLPFFFQLPWRKVIALYGLSAVLLILIAIAGLRASSVDPDYLTYLGWFDDVRAGSLEVSDFVKDPAFVGISSIVANLRGSYSLVAAIFAGVALSMKWAVGGYATPLRFFPLFIYLEFCRFYLVQDMTAIRAAVAIPLMTLSILVVLRGRRALGCSLFVVAATFHASVGLAVPVLLVAMFAKIESRRVFIYLAITTAALSVALKGLLSYLANLARVADYLNGTYEVSGLRLLSIYFLFRLLVGVFIVACSWKKISDEDKFVVFCSSIGLALQILLSANDALALRSAEVFGIFDVLMFLIPLKVLRRPSQLVYAGVLVLAGFLFFSSSVKIMNPYKTILSFENHIMTSRLVV